MMTIRFLRQVTVFGLIAMLTMTSIQAQEGGGRQRGGRGGFGGGPGGPFGGPRLDRAALLRIDKVRQELKIEEAQAATIDAALDAYNEQRDASPRPDREAFEKMTEEERNAYMEKSRKEREELSKKTDEILVALMEEPQVKSLDEVAIQARLAMSATTTLKADDIKGKLMITDEQIAKLDEAQKAADDERQKTMQEAFAGGGQGGDREAMRARMTEMMTAMQKKSTEAAMAVLTDEQRMALDAMKGAAFELTMRDLMGGRGFGGPPGGGGGRGGQGGGGRGGRPPAE